MSWISWAGATHHRLHQTQALHLRVELDLLFRPPFAPNCLVRAPGWVGYEARCQLQNRQKAWGSPSSVACEPPAGMFFASFCIIFWSQIPLGSCWRIRWKGEICWNLNLGKARKIEGGLKPSKTCMPVSQSSGSTSAKKTISFHDFSEIPSISLVLFCTQLLMFSRNSGGNNARLRADSRPGRPVAAMLGRSVWTNRRRFTASTSERRVWTSWDSRLSLMVSWDGEDMLRLAMMIRRSGMGMK